jgi:DNA-binding NtrC family response regulator
VQAIFRPEGFEVAMAHDGESGLIQARALDPEIVLLDMRLPGLDGLSVLEKLMQERPELPVIMLTADAEVKSAVRATQLGAFDYLTKPIDVDEVVLAVHRALERRALRSEIEDLRRQVNEGTGLSALMGHSVQVAEIAQQVKMVAATSFSVLIVGETGTGKELVAQALHRQSERRSQPFVALDCGAIPELLLESELFGHERGAFTGADRRKEGSFRLAEGGTLLLDEIGNLPLALQVKLLRVLESRQLQAVGASRSTPMNVRFLAATNDNLLARVSAGEFRSDLYFRLAQYTISLPPLRARRSDISPLARRFLEEVSLELRRPIRDIEDDAMVALEQYDWPGNVRELRNVVRQAALESHDLVLRRAGLKSLLGAPPVGEAKPSARLEGRSLRDIADEAARAAERQAITEALRTTHGNKSQAARLLQTDYKTLHLKIKSFGIRARDFGP